MMFIGFLIVVFVTTVVVGLVKDLFGAVSGK
jgi:Flp pilus assembly pilin Flp